MATNRFYYSEKQANCMGVDLANEVLVNGKWLRYSEWISKRFPDKKSNWDDAVLVHETEKDGFKININPNHSMFDMPEVD
jgi:hypothetical protein